MVNEISLGTATAFTYRSEDQLFLVSNWHVLAGRHTDTGQTMHRSGAVPDALEVLFHAVPSEDDPSPVQWKPVMVPLVDEQGTPLWYEHPESGQDVDIAVLPITEDSAYRYFPINELPTTEMVLQAGTDLFVIGFPLGLVAGGALPIWKRASIASEPMVDPMDRPVILVDTATRSGMSGSPAVMRASNYATPDGGFRMSAGTLTMFVGVYSGRIGEDELRAQLGQVWKRHLIDEVISGKQPGDYRLREAPTLPEMPDK